MRTRSQKLAHENAGGPPSPPQQLPAVQKRARVPKKKPTIGAEDAKDSNSEATTSSLVPNVHPVRTGARKGRAPSKPSVAPATQIPASLPQAPKVPHALIHVWVDAAAEDLASARPVNDPNILLAVPSDLISNLLNFFGTNPTSHRHNGLTFFAGTKTISVSPSSNKRKLPADADPPPPAQRARLEPTPPPVRPKARNAFRRDGLAEMHLESDVQSTLIPHYQPSDTIPDTPFFRRVDRYTADGRLQLGLEPITISSEEGSNALFQPSRPVSPPLEDKSVTEENQPVTERPNETASSHGPTPDIVEESATTATSSTEPTVAAPLRLEDGSVPETPRGSRWNLGTLMNTARRYIPSLNRRAEHMTPVAENSVVASGLTDASTSAISTPEVIRPALTGLEPKDQSAETINAPATATATKRREHQEHRQRRKNREHGQTTSTKKVNRDKNQVQSDRPKQGERGSHPHRKRAQAREDLRREAEMATTPGTKRKRLPSPDTIPNPRGCSYGIDLDYFGYYSSDEGDEIGNTPVKPRPSKSRRISKPGDVEIPIVGDPQNARPYSGVLFAESDPAYHGGNIFSEVKTAERATRMASETRANESQKRAYLSKTSSDSNKDALPTTPVTNLTGSFSVPSPSDSDSDFEESPRVISLSGIEKSFSEGKDVPRQVEAPTTTMAAISTHKSPELWNKSPPPRPTPGHKALPSAPKPKASEPLSSSSHITSSSNSGATLSGSRLPAHHVASLPVERSTDSEALRKVREKALQHKPRKPSTLSQSSRLYSSPLADSSEEVSESTAQGAAVVRKDAERNKVSAVQATTKLSGASNVDEAQKNIEHSEGAAVQADTSSTDAGIVDGDDGNNKQSISAPDGFGPFNAYEEYCQTIDPEVASILDKAEVDVNIAANVFKAGMTQFNTDAKEKGKEIAVATTTTAVPLNLSDTRTSVEEYIEDPEVVSFIDANWTPADDRLSSIIFEKLFADFCAQEEAAAAIAALKAGVAV